MIAIQCRKGGGQEGKGMDYAGYEEGIGMLSARREGSRERASSTISRNA